MTDSSLAPGPQTGPPEIDTSVPNSARIWNYWLGGKDNYPVDRAAGDRYRATYPEIVDVARASRQFLTRAVRYLAGEARVRQFLDIGTGLPTFDNTHEVAQRVAPEAKVVYVDNDPVVLAHARALLTSAREGGTAYVDADLRDPDRILEAAARTLDLGRPVALMLLGILGHVNDDDEARSIVHRLMAALPSGSYLTVCDGTNDLYQAGVQAQDQYNESGAAPYRLRSSREFADFFDGLELVEPGVVSCPRWRPDPADLAAGPPPEMDQFAGVARKP
ncbi:MAG TPA: SAM-dependent methyltransferase [Actinomycetes bacterium]|nr:SAM-dependent methyltransferase [Actinomycetes bacterium]